MTRKKIILIGAVVLALGAGAGASAFYLLSDHRPPELEVVNTYRVECGKSVRAEDLVVEVRDQSKYTLSLSGDGEVNADGHSVRFPKAGTFTVLVEARDAHGRSTQKPVSVTARDVTPPELKVQDIVVELGEDFDCRDAVTAADGVDGDLTGQVQVDDSQVNREKVGTYSVIYAVEDRSGNRAEERGRVLIQPVQAKRIMLDQTELELNGNQHADLHATVLPEDWEGTVEWTSDDPNVATVSDGMVAWAGKGTCTVTAQADSQSVTCKVTCADVEATSIQLDREKLDLNEGESATVKADVSPSNWKGAVEWSSSDETVATVEDGVVTAVGPGGCIVTASAGEKEAECEVNCRRTVIDSMTNMWNSIMGEEDKP